MNQYQDSVTRVRQALNDLHVEAQVLELTDSTKSAAQAATAVGCSVAQIVKSLIFRGINTGEPILALVSGANQVDLSRLANAAGEPVEKADPQFVRGQTGFAIGGVSPIGHPTPPRTFMDRDLLLFDVCWAAAGSPFAVFQIAPDRLCEICRATICDLKR